MAWGVATYLELDVGLAAGLVSGALTESPTMGTASEAIQALAIDDATKQVLLAHVGVADALCYVFGALGVILTCSLIGSWMRRKDSPPRASKFESPVPSRF